MGAEVQRPSQLASEHGLAFPATDSSRPFLGCVDGVFLSPETVSNARSLGNGTQTQSVNGRKREHLCMHTNSSNGDLIHWVAMSELFTQFRSIWLVMARKPDRDRPTDRVRDRGTPGLEKERTPPRTNLPVKPNDQRAISIEDWAGPSSQYGIDSSLIETELCKYCTSMT